MADPRAENCRAFRLENNKVVGVELDVLPMAGAQYRLQSVRLIDEYEAQGKVVTTVTVLDRDMALSNAAVALAWPWEGRPSFAHVAYPGGPGLPVQHVTGNGYNPERGRGPLAIFVGANGEPNSDIVGGLGLPLGHHVAYSLVYREGDLDTGEPPVEPLPPDPETAGDIVALLTEIRGMVARLMWLGR